jgi:integrase
LRFSDYSRIKKEHIQENNGRKYIDMITKKTGERVIIPIRWELDEILKKYKYDIPKTYEQKVNKYIKEIGEIAEINDNIELESTKGGLKVNQVIPKYKLIKTHTARRSGATNMYLAGIPTIDIMKITGHKKESSFLRYICIDKEQTATNLANHKYFNQSKMNVV